MTAQAESSTWSVRYLCHNTMHHNWNCWSPTVHVLLQGPRVVRAALTLRVLGGISQAARAAALCSIAVGPGVASRSRGAHKAALLRLGQRWEHRMVALVAQAADIQHQNFSTDIPGLLLILQRALSQRSDQGEQKDKYTQTHVRVGWRRRQLLRGYMKDTQYLLLG